MSSDEDSTVSIRLSMLKPPFFLSGLDVTASEEDDMDVTVEAARLLCLNAKMSIGSGSM